MNNRLFTYVSESKINMLYNQSTDTNTKESNRELGASFNVGIASISGKTSNTKNNDITIYNKLESVENRLIQAGLVGGVFDNKPLIRGKCQLYCFYGKYYGELVSWAYSYFDADKYALYRYFFYGSAKHITGVGRKEITSTQTFSRMECLFHNESIRALDRRKSRIEGHPEEDNSGEIEPWEIVENCLSSYFYSLYPPNNNSFLVRVDHRETITIEKYLKSPYVRELNMKYQSDEAKNWLSSQRSAYKNLLKLHPKTKYIVYVYGSPIYVEQVFVQEKVHIIDGKNYLYLSDEALVKLVPNDDRECQQNAISQIAKELSQVGLVRESHEIEFDFWSLAKINNWNALDKDRFLKLVREYTTPLPPL